MAKKKAPSKAKAKTKAAESDHGHDHGHTLCWFDIPTKKFDRAVKFYEAMLGTKLEPMDMGEMKMAMFPSGDGCLTQGGSVGAKGVTIYFECSPDCKKAETRAAKAGGKVVQEKMSIAPHGFISIVQDTEGNHVGLHSMK